MSRFWTMVAQHSPNGPDRIDRGHLLMLLGRCQFARPIMLRARTKEGRTFWRYSLWALQHELCLLRLNRQERRHAMAGEEAWPAESRQRRDWHRNEIEKLRDDLARIIERQRQLRAA